MTVNIVHVSFGMMDPTTFIEPAAKVSETESIPIAVSCGRADEIKNDILAHWKILVY